MNKGTNVGKAQHVETGISMVCSEKEKCNLTGTKKIPSPIETIPVKKCKEQIMLKAKCVCGGCDVYCKILNREVI